MGGVRGGGHLALKGTSDPRAASPGGGGTADPRVGCPGTTGPRVSCPGGQFKGGTSHPTTPVPYISHTDYLLKCKPSVLQCTCNAYCP